MHATAEVRRRPRGHASLGRGVGSLRLRGFAAETLAATAAAVVVGYAVQAHVLLAAALAAAVVGLWALTRPSFAALALGASLPALQDLAGGRVGLNVAASDLVLAFFAAYLIVEAGAQRASGVLRALRPIAYALFPYCALLVVLAGAHPGAKSWLNTVQRFELFILPLLVGAFLALRAQHIRVLRAYVIAAAVLSAVWPFDHLNMQKNPAGQLLANAILLVVGVRELRRLALLAPLLAFGLLMTQSRGAVFALVIGVGVLLLMQRGVDLRGLLVRLVPLTVAAALVFHWLPANDRTRMTSFSANANTSAGYPIYIRDLYKRDAERMISAHPWTGVGVGNYLSGVAGGQAQATDPHDVVLLDAAEGGYGLAAAFILLITGVCAALWRLRRVPLAAAAAAVVVATVAHGLVDVYWVRGTPVLGWLLVGAVGGLALRRKTGRVA